MLGERHFEHAFEIFMLATVQVSFIDISKESPCGHGTVICFSVYCGAEAHFGELVDGQPADGVVQNELWVDTLVNDQKDQVNDQDCPHSRGQAPVLPSCAQSAVYILLCGNSARRCYMKDFRQRGAALQGQVLLH